MMLTYILLNFNIIIKSYYFDDFIERRIFNDNVIVENLLTSGKRNFQKFLISNKFYMIIS